MPFASKARFATFPLCMLFLAGCASLNVSLPSITDSPTGERLPGKIIWRDLLTNDPAASQRFYGELFGWEFEKIGEASNLRSNAAYTLIRHNDQLIGGMVDTVALNGRDDISQWVVLMAVEDLDARTEAVTRSGGEIIAPPTNLQARGRLALVRDAEGALLGLLETRDGDPLDSEPEVNGFLWDELWTTDVPNAVDFYNQLAGLEAESVDIDADGDEGRAYRLLKAGDTPRVGVLPVPLEGLEPAWISYIRVEDPAALAARVPGLGGRVIIEAQPRPLGGEVALVTGPSGAGIALQTWPLEP